MIPVNRTIGTELIGDVSTFNIVRDRIKISYLGAFVKLRKTAVIYVMSVCPSVRMKQLGGNLKDYREI
jgi:hypothetical protein